MGLDAVELVLQVEEEFQIRIDDRDAEKIQTVGQLHDYIIEKLPASSPWAITAAGKAIHTTPCLTAVAFYRLRQALLIGIGDPHPKLRPSTSLTAILPVPIRRRAWQLARENLGVDLPQLHYSKPVRTLFMGGAALFAIVGALKTMDSLDGTFATLLVVYFLGAWLLLEMILRCLAVEIEHVRTLGDLSRWVAIRNYDTLLRTAQIAAPQSVWIRLVAIVSDQLAADPMKIKPETSFVKDLGVD